MKKLNQKAILAMAGVLLISSGAYFTSRQAQSLAESEKSTLTRANIEALADSEPGGPTDTTPQSGTKVELHKVYDPATGKLLYTWEEHIPYTCCIYSPGETCLSSYNC